MLCCAIVDESKPMASKLTKIPDAGFWHRRRRRKIGCDDNVCPLFSVGALAVGALTQIHGGKLSLDLRRWGLVALGNGCIVCLDWIGRVSRRVRRYHYLLRQ